MQAIILAGGAGTRLRPYTLVFPKPMLPVGGMPIIATIVHQLAYYGFNDIVISLGYLGDYIRMYFMGGVNTPKGVTIRFSFEDQPLGTTGPLALVDKLDDDFLVINGDILSTIDYADFFHTHRDRHADLSVAVGIKEVKMSLGILDLDEKQRITGFREKPTFVFHDNMGIYVYSRSVMKWVERDKKLDVNVLVAKLVEEKKNVFGYISKEEYFWIDVGQHADYEKANEEFEKRRSAFLPSKGQA
jgi:NDP-mannose synthase